MSQSSGLLATKFGCLCALRARVACEARLLNPETYDSNTAICPLKKTFQHIHTETPCTPPRDHAGMRRHMRRAPPCSRRHACGGEKHERRRHQRLPRAGCCCWSGRRRRAAARRRRRRRRRAAARTALCRSSSSRSTCKRRMPPQPPPPLPSGRTDGSSTAPRPAETNGTP